MRTRGIALLLAAIFVVTIQARAAMPKVVAIAADSSGRSIALSTVSKVAVLKLSPAKAPIQAKLNCISVEHYEEYASPPQPSGTKAATVTWASAKAGNKTYYLTLHSFGPPGDDAIQFVDQLRIATTPWTTGYPRCGASHYSFGAGVGTIAFR